MSRIGKHPVTVPNGVEVAVAGQPQISLFTETNSHALSNHRFLVPAAAVATRDTRVVCFLIIGRGALAQRLIACQWV